MTSGNGNGHEKAQSLGLRPALEAVKMEQEEVLNALLEGPMEPRAALHWKAKAVRAGVGRVSPGMRAILSDPDLSALVQVFLTTNDTSARTYREMLHEHLAVEYARALQEMSTISLEELRRQGVAQAEMSRAYSTTTYR